MKKILTILFCLSTCISYGQDNLKNRDYFSAFLDSTDKSLIILGDNHTSSVGPKIYPALIQYLNKNNGLHTLLIEFGPSEAYFYELYLETGNERWLNYTIFAGSYSAWKRAWRKIYNFNQTLKTPLNIIGIDFDRTRTFGYAFYKIFSDYDNIPKQIDSLMAVISDTTFYNTYTIGYPKKKGKQFVKNTEKILRNNLTAINQLLSEQDFEVIHQMLQNKAVGYGGNREQELAENTKRVITRGKDDEFLLYIGRSHAYYTPTPYFDYEIRMAKKLSEAKNFSVLSGVILLENSKLWGADYKEAITLHELKEKKPWKEYYNEINRKAASDLIIILLNHGLSPLKKYVDYIIVARGKEAIDI